MDYSGPEQRKPDSERRGPYRDMAELVSSIRTMRRDLGCMKAEMEKYVPLLERLTRAEVTAQTLKLDVVRHLMIGGAWSMVIGIGVSVWYWLQHHVGSGR